MRNVTNKTADNVETPAIRRARGRPRKPDAFSNAQRQAPPIGSESVTPQLTQR
jgi:hypothetical protein